MQLPGGGVREAFKIASFWLTDVLEDCTEFGAFSEQNLGEPAIEYFPKRAFVTLKDPNCKWKWKLGVKLSTQFLYVDSSVLAAYQGSQAMEASANSYSGINKCAVFLNPRSMGAGSVVVTPVAPSGSGGSGSGGSEGGSETPSGGSETPGGGDDEPGGDDH